MQVQGIYLGLRNMDNPPTGLVNSVLAHLSPLLQVAQNHDHLALLLDLYCKESNMSKMLTNNTFGNYALVP